MKILRTWSCPCSGHEGI